MTARPDGTSRYSTVAIVFHWAIAALIVTNVVLGLRSTALDGLARFQLIQLHKSVGITILVLSVARLAWRLGHRPPPYPADLGRATRAAASTVHWLFYVLMIGLPLTGWLMVSASPTNIPTLLFGSLPWPHLPGVHDLPMTTRVQVADAANATHVTLTYIAYLLIALHVAAALKHHFIDKDGQLARMLPFLSPRSREI
jgi:cytochrome b561